MWKSVNNGDVFDIGQTINGVSKFVWLNGKWHYFDKSMSYEYQYDQNDLTKLVLTNEFNEIILLGNILNSFENL